MDKVIEQAMAILLAQGLSGVIIIGLIYLIFLLRAELRDTRSAHRVELAEKDKLIYEIQEERVGEARAGYEIIRSIQTTQDAIVNALKGR